MNNNPTAAIYIKVSQLENNGIAGYGIVLKYKGKEQIISAAFENTSTDECYFYGLRDVLKPLRDSINIIIYSNNKDIDKLFVKYKSRMRTPRRMTILFKYWDKYSEHDIRVVCENVAKEAIEEFND